MQTEIWIAISSFNSLTFFYCFISTTIGQIAMSFGLGVGFNYTHACLPLCELSLTLWPFNYSVLYHVLKIKIIHTFSKPVATQSFLAVGELDDIQDFSLRHQEIFWTWLLYYAVRIYHHGVQNPEWTFILENNGQNCHEAIKYVYLLYYHAIILVFNVVFLRDQPWDLLFSFRTLFPLNQ